MIQSVADKMHAESLKLAEKWAIARSNSGITTMLMADDLFDFITSLINMIGGLEDESSHWRRLSVEQNDEISLLKQERDDLNDECISMSEHISKLKTQLETANRCLSLIEDIVKFR